MSTPAAPGAAVTTISMSYAIPAVPVVVLVAPPGSGKTRLLHQWASQVPADERWTFIVRGEIGGEVSGVAPQTAAGLVDVNLSPPPVTHKSDGAHIIQLAHDCACCNGKLILQTHLGRTLRMRRPDRLFIEAVLDDHLPATLQWLAGPQWEGWLGPVRCMTLLPLMPPSDSTGDLLSQSDQLALSCADVACFLHPPGQADPALAGQRLLQARQQGGAAQWRLTAPIEKCDWPVVEQALGTARRRI